MLNLILWLLLRSNERWTLVDLLGEEGALAVLAGAMRRRPSLMPWMALLAIQMLTVPAMLVLAVMRAAIISLSSMWGSVLFALLFNLLICGAGTIYLRNQFTRLCGAIRSGLECLECGRKQEPKDRLCPQCNSKNVWFRGSQKE